MLKRLEDIDFTTYTVQTVSGGIVFSREVVVKGKLIEKWRPSKGPNCPMKKEK